MTDQIIKKDVNIAELEEPMFLSLVGSPANQVAFKVLRDDLDSGSLPEKSPDQSIPKKKKKMPKKKRGDNPLIELEFPDGWDEEGVQEFADTYGLSDYSISEANGRYVLRRDAEISIRNDCMSVVLQKGVKAYIRNDKKEDSEKVTLSALEFAADYFVERSEVKDWLIKNNIDISEDYLETSDELHRLQRIATVETQETRRVKIDDGVVAVVIRTDQPDSSSWSLKQEEMAAVNAAVYGKYGWGELDFSSELENVEFYKATREAANILNSVVGDLVFNSPLSTEQRKVLIENAATQFSGYVGSLVDALPNQVIVANRSIIKKELTMSQEGSAVVEATPVVVPEVEAVAIEPVVREDKPAPVAFTAEAFAVAAKKLVKKRQDVFSDGYVQGSDQEDEANEDPMMEAIESIVEAAVSAVVASMRSEKEKTTVTPVVEVVTEGEPKADEGVTQVLRAVADLAAIQSSVVDRLKALEGVTIVRSDSSDGKQVAAKKNTFAGVFGPLK